MLTVKGTNWKFNLCTTTDIIIHSKYLSISDRPNSSSTVSVDQIWKLFVVKLRYWSQSYNRNVIDWKEDAQMLRKEAAWWLSCFWQCRAEKGGGTTHTLCEDEIAELLPQTLTKNRQKYHSTDDDCYMKNICKNNILHIRRQGKCLKDGNNA